MTDHEAPNALTGVTATPAPNSGYFLPAEVQLVEVRAVLNNYPISAWLPLEMWAATAEQDRPQLLVDAAFMQELATQPVGDLENWKPTGISTGLPDTP